MDKTRLPFVLDPSDAVAPELLLNDRICIPVNVANPADALTKNPTRAPDISDGHKTFGRALNVLHEAIENAVNVPLPVHRYSRGVPVFTFIVSPIFHVPVDGAPEAYASLCSPKIFIGLEIMLPPLY